MSVLRRSLLNVSSFLVNAVTWLLILILYGPFILILVIWRLSVNWLAMRIYADLTPCSPNDTLLVHETPSRQPILVGGFILKVKGHIDDNKLGTLFEELFLAQDYQDNYLNLYCDLVKFCGYLFKRRIVNKIKLKGNHLQVKELKEGEDFKEIVASWFQEKFEKGLPLWQMLVLNPEQQGQDENGGGREGDFSYFAFKAHHVLMDGYSFVHILDKLTGMTSPGEWSGAPASPSPAPPLTNNNVDEGGVGGDGDNHSTVSTTTGRKNSLWTELKILFSTPEVVASFTLPNITWKDSNKFPESKSLSKFEMLPMAVGTSSLKPIREMRRKLGVHFPSIVYGLQAGALRAALLDHRSGKIFSEECLPESILITSSLPVVGYPHPHNKFTNHWSGGYIKVPLKTASPKERILGADHSLQKLLSKDATYITWRYLAFLLYLLPCWFHSLLEKCQCLHLCKYRSSMSCIPQSCTVQYNLMGLPVQNIYHAPVMKDSFLSAGKVLLGCSSSHNEQVDFSMFGHPDWFPDQEKMDKVIGTYLKKELELLARECEIDVEKLEWR